MLIVLTCLMFWSFSLVFFFCEFGELILTDFDGLSDGLYDNEWYLYPLDVQRMIPTILIGTQDVISIRGFGNIECTRNTFKMVRPLNFLTKL